MLFFKTSVASRPLLLAKTDNSNKGGLLVAATSTMAVVLID
jgi:hypothetical protein